MPRYVSYQRDQAFLHCTAAATHSGASRAKKREYDDEEDEEEEEEEEDEKPKPKKRTKKPKEVIEVSSELQDFWTAHPPSLLYRCAACCWQLYNIVALISSVRLSTCPVACDLLPCNAWHKALQRYNECRNKARDEDGDIYTFAPGKKIAAFDFVCPHL